MRAYLLLDRSGSMESLWVEALSSINGYVNRLEGQDIRVTLAAFDSVSYDLIREDVRPQDWRKITSDEIRPRDMTPLYDAAGKMLDRMFRDDPRKAVLVVMTDGFENNSKEYTRESIKAKVNRAIESGWSVVFLGANFDKVETVSSSVGVGTSNTVYSTRWNLGSTMDSLATKTAFYNTSGGTAEAMSFTEQEKTDAAKDKDENWNTTLNNLSGIKLGSNTVTRTVSKTNQ